MYISCVVVQVAYFILPSKEPDKIASLRIVGKYIANSHTQIRNNNSKLLWTAEIGTNKGVHAKYFSKLEEKGTRKIANDCGCNQLLGYKQLRFKPIQHLVNHLEF